MNEYFISYEITVEDRSGWYGHAEFNGSPNVFIKQTELDLSKNTGSKCTIKVIVLTKL